MTNGYYYLANMTSEIRDVTPRRFGTGGGVLLRIFGTNFVAKDIIVTIGDIPCDVKTVNGTHVTCVTQKSLVTSLGIDVSVGWQNDRGAAVPVNATVSYIDVWSSVFTWGGVSIPKKGKSRNRKCRFSFPHIRYFYIFVTKL